MTIDSAIKIRLFALAFLPAFLIGQSIEVQGQLSQEALAKWVSQPDLEFAGVSIDVRELKGGQKKIHYAANQALTPASALKVLTTATALEILGPDTRFTTSLYLDGVIEGEILRGNIIIRGGGDPTLGSSHFPDGAGFIEQWMNNIRKLGIKRIEGDIIGDGTYFSAETLVGSTPVNDIGNYYGSGAQALSVYDNTYNLYFSSANTDGGKTEIVRTIPEVPYLLIRNEVKASSVNKDQAFIYAVPNAEEQYVYGTIPKGKKSFKIQGSIPKPEKLLASQLKSSLIEGGIEVIGEGKSAWDIEGYNWDLKQGLKGIVFTQSPTVAQITEVCNRLSINTYANTLLFHIAKKVSDQADYLNGVEAMHAYWQEKGVDTEGWFQEDGSGLSRSNAISASVFTSVLLKLSASNKKHLIKGLKNYGVNASVKAKSGYLYRVRSYTGFFTGQDGKEYVFAVLVNNYTCTPGEMRKKIVSLIDTW